MSRAPLERVTANPFFVLGLTPSASRVEVERAGQRLLALLGVKSAAAAHYRTPLGEFARDEDKVRTALAQLREPEQRVLWELWAEVSAERVPRVNVYPEAHRLLGWRRAWRSQ